MGNRPLSAQSERVASATRSSLRAAARRAWICGQSRHSLRSVACAVGRGKRLLSKSALLVLAQQTALWHKESVCHATCAPNAYENGAGTAGIPRNRLARGSIPRRVDLRTWAESPFARGGGDR